MTTPTLTPVELQRMDAYWRAANYLSVGQIYLYDNPLLRRPLCLADVKRMLLGHWGTTPGQNFIYAHLMDAIDRLPRTGDRGISLKQQLRDKPTEHKRYIAKHGQDLPEIRDWKWDPAARSRSYDGMSR